MRHRVNGRKFNRRTEQRQALLNSLARALLRYEQIKTTLPKAKELRPYVEKLISLGKEDRDPSAKQQDVVVADAQNSADAAISS